MRNFDIFGTQEVIENKIPIAFTFGNFDGVHLGHRFLISSMLKKCPHPLVVMIFDPHPAVFFKPEEEKKFLTTLDERIELLLNAGVDTVIVQKFAPSFALMSADEFCNNFLAEYFNIQHIFLGYNLSYGKHRKGDAAHMKQFAKKYNWNIIQLPPHEDEYGQIISSTRIRSALCDADPKLAEQLLGRPYSISGSVFHGDGRGKQLGFPTANIDFDESIVIPHFGVYTCEVEMPKKYSSQRFYGVMNCGMRPTIASKKPKVQIETHILNFDDDIYNEDIVFYLKSFIRPEQKFGSLEHLKLQMEKDIEFAQINRF